MGPGADSETVTTQNDDGLAAEDVRRILSVSLVEENMEYSSQPECRIQCDTQTAQISSQSQEDSEEDSSDEGEPNKFRCEVKEERVEDSSDEGNLNKLWCAVEKALPDGIRHRQLTMLSRNAEKRQEAVRRHNETTRDYRLAGRRRLLVK